MGSGNEYFCGIGWTSGGQSQWFICGQLWGRWLDNLPEWWVMLGDKWEVTIKVAVELVVPVVARVNGPLVANCEESGRISQSSQWWWVRNSKWYW